MPAFSIRSLACRLNIPVLLVALSSTIYVVRYGQRDEKYDSRERDIKRDPVHTLLTNDTTE